ncbi:hypothetical protein OG259_08575 [Streptomyces sp. NBC_00250]|uniref:hypothetical protein n=1 Tax=Streptomyces sp. NBC_00250 TaxID=2903641 RepID=UPI002E2A0DD1|nr:hypothetical protein [Streptomyces sp. NBC_00250]
MPVDPFAVLQALLRAEASRAQRSGHPAPEPAAPAAAPAPAPAPAPTPAPEPPTYRDEPTYGKEAYRKESTYREGPVR